MRGMRALLPSLLLLLTLLMPACSGLGGSRHSLPALMVKRLDWMDDVAEAKRAKGLPITDPKREAELLRSMMQRGDAAGLNDESVRLFFSGQMQAAKVRQEEWLRQHPTATTTQAPDLASTIRPALDEIGTQMIEQLEEETRHRTPIEAAALVTQAQNRLMKAGYSEDVVKPAVKGLKDALDMYFASWP